MTELIRAAALQAAYDYHCNSAVWVTGMGAQAYKMSRAEFLKTWNGRRILRSLR